MNEIFSRSVNNVPRVDIGIITALPIEQLAVSAVIPDLVPVSVAGDSHNYLVGSTPSREPGVPHVVAVAMPSEVGTRSVASLCTDMARSFPDLRTFVVCGIAAGVPSADPDRHVALGDIVVATGGIVDYRHERLVDGSGTVRDAVQKPARHLIDADRTLSLSSLSVLWRHPELAVMGRSG